MKRVVVLGALCIVCVTGAGCGGDSGTSDAERELIARDAAKTAILKERLAEKNRRLAEAKNRPGGAPVVSSSGSVPSSSYSGGGTPSYRESCGSDVYAAGSASCPFALNISAHYWSNPGAGSYRVFSPVTGVDYDVSCSGSNPVTCTGGNNAIVYLK